MSSRLSQAQLQFLAYLTKLNPEKHRAQLAVMRRGLSAPPGEDVNMYRFIARFIPDEDRANGREDLYYLVAALYALHPQNIRKGNFGNHMALAGGQSSSMEATERRFTLLLNAHSADLPDYLRQAVSFIASRQDPEVRVNWHALFEDLLFWNDPQKTTQRKWANGFWGYNPSETDENVSALSNVGG